MKKSRIILVLMIAIPASLLLAQNDSDSLAYKYIIDYDVPESPAFSVLGINPNSVMRGSAAKPVAVHIANQFLGGGSVDNGVAIDFNPYFSLLGGRIANIKDYREDYWKRLLANMQWSVATTALEEFPNDLAYGIGGRLTLWDSKDLLFNKDLGNQIDDCLIKVADDKDVMPDNNDSVKNINFNGCVSNAYDAIRKELLGQKGGAISLGWAMSGRIQGATLRSDSISIIRNQVWLSGQYSFGKGFDVLGMVMQRFEVGEGAMNHTSLGLATRYSRQNFNFSGELIYQISGSNRILDGGFNAGFRVLPRVMYVFHLATRDDPDNDNAKKKLVVRSGLRWNFSESYDKK